MHLRNRSHSDFCALCTRSCGSSRKKDNTEQSDTPTPTEDPDPTDKPNPTDAPTDTPTPTPTNTPSPEPTDEPEPTPFAVGELNYSVIKGDWKATRSFTMDEAKEFLEGYMDDEDTKIFLSVMKDAGMNPKVNVDFTLSFTSEKDVKITYKADALEFLNAIKQLFSDEESAYKLMEAYTGMSVDVLKTRKPREQHQEHRREQPEPLQNDAQRHLPQGGRFLQPFLLFQCQFVVHFWQNDKTTATPRKNQPDARPGAPSRTPPKPSTLPPRETYLTIGIPRVESR